MGSEHDSSCPKPPIHPQVHDPPARLLLCPAGAGAQERQGLLGFPRAFSDQALEDLACNHWLPFSPRSDSRCTALGLSPPGPRGPLCPLGIQRHKNEGHRNQTLGRAVEHHRKPRQLSVRLPA